MATTIDSKLNDDIIAKRGLDAFVKHLVSLRGISTDFSDEVVSGGAKVSVPLYGTLTATDGTGANDDYENDNGSVTACEVVMDGYAKVTVGISDMQFMNSPALKLENFGVQMGNAVAAKVMTGIMAKITKTNFTTTLSPTKDDTIADLMLMARAQMTADGVPVEDRCYVAAASAYNALMKDGNIQLASAMVYGGTEVVREGKIPRYLGFDLAESAVMPSSSAAPNGFVIHPSALALATRALQSSSPSSYMAFKKIVDKTTGITMSYRRHYSTKQGKHFLTFECNYGVGVGLTKGCILMPAIPSA